MNKKIVGIGTIVLTIVFMFAGYFAFAQSQTPSVAPEPNKIGSDAFLGQDPDLLYKNTVTPPAIVPKVAPTPAKTPPGAKKPATQGTDIQNGVGTGVSQTPGTQVPTTISPETLPAPTPSQPEMQKTPEDYIRGY